MLEKDHPGCLIFSLRTNDPDFHILQTNLFLKRHMIQMETS